MTASTRCSRVRGPATVPSFVTWPDQRHAGRARLRHLGQARGHLAHLPHAPGGAAELGAGEGLHAVDHRQRRHGRLDRPDGGRQVGGRRPAPPRRPLPRRARPCREPARPTPRRSGRGWRGRPRRVRPASWSRRVLLPMPGSPPKRTIEPGTSPPPRTRSSSPIPLASRDASALLTAPIGEIAAEPAEAARSRARRGAAAGAARG